MKTISFYLLFFAIIFSATSQAQQRERLAAKCKYYTTPSGVLTQRDSTTYVYSGYRSIDSAWGAEQAFDTCYGWLYNFTSSDFVLWYRYVQHWSPSDIRQNELLQYWDTIARTFFDGQYGVDSYSVNNKALLYHSQHYDTSQHIWTNSTRLEKAYDQQDRLVENAYFRWDSIGGTWHLDTTQIYSLSYDVNGQIVSSLWINKPSLYSELLSMTYDSLGRNDTITTDMPLNGASTWRHFYRQIYSYNSAGDAYYGLFQNWDTIRGWITAYQTNYVYDSHHNNVQYINQNIDTAGQAHDSEKYLATYDSYDMITSSQYQIWDTSGVWVHQGLMYHYYYELYTAPSGIADVSSSAEVHLYPMPASHMLNVDIKWQEPQPSTIMLYDLTGRICGEWTMPSAATYHGYIPVGMLPEGTYVAHISSPAGNIQRTINIVR